MSDIFDKINKIFKEIFDDEHLEITRTYTSEDIEEWNSLAHINIIVACENEFGIKFQIDEIVSIRNVGDIVDLIGQKGDI